MPKTTMHRLLILGTGTGIGKTYVSRVLAKGLGVYLSDYAVIALKPIESGVAMPAPNESAMGERSVETDAILLAAASSPPFSPPNPPYWLPEPLSPHLSARRSGQTINLEHVISWIDANEQSSIHGNICVTMSPNVTYCNDQRCIAEQCPSDSGQLSRDDCSANTGQLATVNSDWASIERPRTVSTTVRRVTIIETAGAVFSPLNTSQTNFDLALALKASLWILVAPDRLGVLHELTTTLATMKLRGRLPDFIVLSQPDPEDASLGTNATELRHLRIADVDGVIEYGGASPEPIARRLAEVIRSAELPADPAAR